MAVPHRNRRRLAGVPRLEAAERRSSHRSRRLAVHRGDRNVVAQSHFGGRGGKFRRGRRLGHRDPFARLASGSGAGPAARLRRLTQGHMARRDGDTPGTPGEWDPATGVRLAAALGAAARAVATNKGVMNDVYAEPLVRAAGVQYCVELIDNEVHADAGWDPLMAGFLNILATQSRFLDHYLARVVRAGIRQAVILASGLDTRPYRLWWPTGTTVFEIDQPRVVDFKTQTMRSMNATPSATRRALGIDLRRDWPEALRRVGFDAGEPTVWIAEGLFIGFLSPATQDRLLDNLTELSAPGSRAAADYLPEHQRPLL